MKETDLLAWIDIETTGSDVKADELLEVAVIVTDRDLNELERENWIRHWPYNPMRENVDSYVIDMHRQNGLWTDVADPDAKAWHTIRTEMVVFFQEMLKDHSTYEKFVMCGSGVARFDYTWFQLNFPKLISEYFRYYCLDVGIIRRALELSGVVIEGAPKSEDLKHRAMDDVEDHLAEWKMYRHALGMLKGEV